MKKSAIIRFYYIVGAIVIIGGIIGGLLLIKMNQYAPAAGAACVLAGMLMIMKASYLERIEIYLQEIKTQNKLIIERMDTQAANAEQIKAAMRKIEGNTTAIYNEMNQQTPGRHSKTAPDQNSFLSWQRKE